MQVGLQRGAHARAGEDVVRDEIERARRRGGAGAQQHLRFFAEALDGEVGVGHAVVVGLVEDVVEEGGGGGGGEVVFGGGDVVGGHLGRGLRLSGEGQKLMLFEFDWGGGRTVLKAVNPGSSGKIRAAMGLGIMVKILYMKNWSEIPPPKKNFRSKGAPGAF